MNVSVGYAGENTTFTLNASNSSGKTASFQLYKEISTDNWEMIYSENNIPISNDDWSYTIIQTLAQGHYRAYFLSLCLSLLFIVPVAALLGHLLYLI